MEACLGNAFSNILLSLMMFFARNDAKNVAKELPGNRWLLKNLFLLQPHLGVYILRLQFYLKLNRRNVICFYSYSSFILILALLDIYLAYNVYSTN